MTLDLRHEFDLRERVYLDGANHGPMPRRSLAAVQAALEWKRDPATLDDADYFRLPDRVRAAGAKLLGCAADDVALATGASLGISLAACGMDWRAGDHIVVPSGEFPANDLPWRALAARGVKVEFVAPDHVLESIRPDTRCVAAGHVNFATGRRLDIDSIGARCAEVGAMYVVDASQSVGAMPFDAARARASIVAVAGYKWLLSPYGTGLCYVHPDWVERVRLPTFNWATIVGADDFNNLVGLEPRQRPGAIRFDVPETAAFLHGAAMAESLEFLVGVGPDAIYAHVIALIDRLVAALPERVRVDSPTDGATRSTILRLVPEGDAAAVHRRLRQQGFALSLRQGGLRVAPGVWNVPADVDRLAAALAS